MSETLQLNLNVLEWAAYKAGYESLSDFARSLYKTQSTIEKILSGNLNFEQIKKASEKAKIPFGYLFLDRPPEEVKIDLPDLRTRNNATPYSTELVETYKDIIFKQYWFKEYLSEHEVSDRDFVGKFSVQDDVELIAADIKLNLGLNHPKTSKDKNEYFENIVNKAEKIGILIFRNSFLKQQIKKPLDSDEFLGFAIADKLVPVIFINYADKTAARIFTLAHELAHIWIGESGVGDSGVFAQEKLEKKCNQIAAELLLPKKEFLEKWENSEAQKNDKIHSIATEHRISELVVARIAKENDKISPEEYWSLHKKVQAHFIDEKKNSKNPKGPLPKTMTPIRNSRVFTKTVLDLLKSQQIGFKEAGNLLNVRPNSLGSYLE